MMTHTTHLYYTVLQPGTCAAHALAHICQADCTRPGVKDLDVLLADESLVLILDDTEHVWEHHGANLIQVGCGAAVTQV